MVFWHEHEVEDTRGESAAGGLGLPKRGGRDHGVREETPEKTAREECRTGPKEQESSGHEEEDGAAETGHPPFAGPLTRRPIARGVNSPRLRIDSGGVKS